VSWLMLGDLTEWTTTGDDGFLDGLGKGRVRC